MLSSEVSINSVEEPWTLGINSPKFKNPVENNGVEPEVHKLLEDVERVVDEIQKSKLKQDRNLHELISIYEAPHKIIKD